MQMTVESFTAIIWQKSPNSYRISSRLFAGTFGCFFRQNHIENAVFVFCFDLVSINAGNIEPPLVRTIGAFPTDVVFLGFVNLFLLMNSGQCQRIAVDIQLNFRPFQSRAIQLP